MAWSSLECGTLFLFFFRYARLLINIVSHWTFRPISVPEEPTYSSKDVTVIIPTIDGEGEDLRRTIRTCLATHPAEVIVVTVESNLKRALAMAAELSVDKIRVLSVAKANKRRQMCRAIPEVMTNITIFADDDVIWPKSLLPWILAPFESGRIGAVGTSQRLVRPERQSLWSFLGALYLERRNFDCSATLNIDGGLPCLSGRTVAYRSSILQDEDFTFEFTNETWRRYQLNADDDNFITRWLLKHDWEIAMQYHKDAEVLTTLEDSPKYLKQCLRWVRSNWRSNLTSMFVERQYWYTHPWTTYAVLLTTLTAWAIMDPVLYLLLLRVSGDWEYRTTARIIGALWIFVIAKSIKLMGHFIRHPVDVLLLPVSIIFGYVHGIIKLIGLFTLSETAWGSREGADTDNRFRMIRLPPYGGFRAIDEAKMVSTKTEREPILPSYNSRNPPSPTSLTSRYND